MTNEYEIQGDITVVKLVSKKRKCIMHAIIDTSDLDKVKSIDGTWHLCYSKSVGTFYVITTFKKNDKGGKFERNKFKTMSMHRIVFDKIEKKLVVDHINHDTLDNRRSVNLRVVTEKVNRHNRKPKPASTEKKIS